MSEKWSYCPECGSEEIHHEEGDHKQCADCHQEWFADIDYSDVVRNHLTGYYSNWITTVERKDAALAAKDARIAELEEENSHLRHGMTGDYDLDAWLEWCAKKDATPSEDGGEVPEVVAFIKLKDGKRWRLYWEDEFLPSDEIESLMTVAQHERIVAAKDAEIARLLDDRKKDAVLIHELRTQPGSQPASQSSDAAPVYQFHAREIGESDWAPCDHSWYLYCQKSPQHDTRVVEIIQPARQVGGDERDEFRAWFLGRYEYFDNVPSIAQARAEAAWMARAALAPAAVVMPEPKKYTWDEIVGLVSEVLGCQYQKDPDFFIGHQMPGINFNSLSRIIDRVQHREVARLNRRAIPEGLLERICDNNFFGSAAIDELRALLGKEVK